MLRSPLHPRRRGLPRRALLGLPLLALLAAAPLGGGRVPAPVTAVRAADCPLPPALCPPPSSDPTPRPTRRPATPAPSPTDAATPTAVPTPTAAPTATPKPASTPRAIPAASSGSTPAPAATPAPAGAASPGPSASPPATGADPPRDATPVRTVGTVAPDRSAVRAWQVAMVGICAIALAVLLVLRTQRQRRRAALHARFNRMRADRGLPPLTPKQIDFLGPRRRLI